MEHSVKQRLMQFLKYKKLSQGKFERACNLSNGYINNFKNSIGAEKLQNIFSTFPELNKDWLLSGEGEMIVSETPTEEKIEEIPTAVSAIAGCVDCRVLQVRLEEKQTTIDTLREQLDKVQEANLKLLDLLKSTVTHADTNKHQKEKIG